MSDVVKKRDDNMRARYEVTNPYAAFANESGPGIVGRLLTCKKGDWAIGQDSTPVPPELWLSPYCPRDNARLAEVA